ncbi:MAG: hypothetical protein OQL08_00205 [Gammaproteobacteria bacterium]|nr:hypothetical protein [Gammaproteobacteria bacterium]
MKSSFLAVALLYGAATAADEPQKHDDIRYLIMDLQSAALSGELQQLLAFIPPHFKYSFGGDDSREGAARYYREYPEKLPQLYNTLAQGCRRQGDDFYSCPPQAAQRDVIYFGPRAGFNFDRASGQWQFSYFLEGD